MRGLLILLLCAVSAPALARAPFEGVWSLKAEYCTAKPAQTGDYPVAITREGWSGYEFWCDFKSIRRQGRDYVIKAHCGGEENEETASIRLRRIGADLAISTPEGKMARHVRCKVCDDARNANRYPCRAMGGQP